MAQTKQQRREAAAERQAAYDKLTLQQKLARAEAEGGKRVIAKLRKKIAEELDAAKQAKANPLQRRKP